MKEIPLTQGYAAIVDDGDFAALSQYKWHAFMDSRKDGSMRRVYARRATAKGRPAVFMHRFILDSTDSGIEVDHEDGDGLNCQRYNLRTATHADNQHNRKLQRNNTSGFKGVTWHKQSQKWHAKIRVSGAVTSLGLFSDKVRAAKAYDIAALHHFGSFAKINFMEGTDGQAK
jgi:hypothetical protein